MSSNKSKLFVKNILLVAVGILVISIIILSLVPPVSKDALIHHLAVPKLYLKHGGIYEIPFMEFSYYPMNLDLLYMIPLYFGNDIAPKFIHFVFAFLMAWLIYSYIKSRANERYGLLGVILFLSIPIIIKLSITVYVDLGETLFSFAALIFMLKWLRNDFRLRYLIYSGIMCGLALGIKYNGLVTLFVLTLFVPYLYSRYNEIKKQNFIKSVGYCFVFLIISLTVFSPWMIRNYYWKGNPVYPLYNKFFNPQNPINETKKNASSENNGVKQNYGFFTYRSIIYKESGIKIALLPIRIFFQGRDGDPQYFDGKLNPFLLILPFFGFYRLRDDPEDLKREKKIMLAFTLLFFGFAFFTAVFRIRYISPIIPPLVLLSVFGIKNFFDFTESRSSRLYYNVGKAFIVISLGFFLILNGIYITNLYKAVDPFPYIKGKINRDEYISRFIPEYPILKYINNNLSPDAKIYFIFLGKRGYYCDRDYIFNIGIISHLIKSAHKPKDIIKGLRASGITHLLINYRLFERWMGDNFTEERQALTRQFFQKYTNLLCFNKGFGLIVLMMDNEKML